MWIAILRQAQDKLAALLAMTLIAKKDVCHCEQSEAIHV